MAANAVLKRFDRYFYVDAGPDDHSQVPAVNGLLQFYLQGATMASAALFPTNGILSPLDVYLPGSFFGTALQPNTGLVYHADGVHSINVWVTPTGTLAASDPGAEFTLGQGDRIINSSAPVQPFQGPLGSDPLASLHTDDKGRAACYIKAYRYDYVFTPAEVGAMPAVFVDAEGSFVMR